MQLPPYSVLQSWPTPNYKDPITRGPANVITNVLFFTLSLFFVCVRSFTRIHISKSFGWDDGLIVAAMFPTTAFSILGVLTATKFNWDRHMWDVPFELIQVGLDISVATELLFSVATALTKLSMLSLTYRVVTQGSGNLWKYIVASMVLVVAQSTTFCFVVIFQCKTPAAYLTLTWHPQPACLSETAHLLAAGIVNVITDILVVGLPMPMVLKLKLPKRQQIAVAFLFGVGLLVTLAGAARCVYLYETTTQWDKTWLAYPVYICSSVELFVGIICASIPATKTFFTHFVPKVVRSTLHSRSSQSKTQKDSTASLQQSKISKLASVIIDTDDGALPLSEYNRDKAAILKLSETENAIRVRHSICIFESHRDERPTTPDSKAETVYQIGKSESQDHLVFDTPPTPPTRPPPIYHQPH